MVNRGKSFEQRFKTDFERIPNSLCIRLPDQMSGYKGSGQNICDYICYNYPNQYFIECKAHKGASIPFDKISQYKKMKSVVGRKGVRTGVVLWLYEKDVVYYIPISTITEMKNNGEKSVGIRSVKEGYNIIQIPSIKLKVYMESDYSILSNLKEGE